jgi:hypothetical protein
MALVVSSFLIGAQLFVPAAMAGAGAAAIYIATVDFANKMAEPKQALTEAQATAQLVATTPAHARLPSIMFVADDINHMHDMVPPNLLVGFQRIMFVKGKCFRLDKDTKVPKSE